MIVVIPFFFLGGWIKWIKRVSANWKEDVLFFYSLNVYSSKLLKGIFINVTMLLYSFITCTTVKVILSITYYINIFIKKFIRIFKFLNNVFFKLNLYLKNFIYFFFIDKKKPKKKHLEKEGSLLEQENLKISKDGRRTQCAHREKFDWEIFLEILIQKTNSDYITYQKKLNDTDYKTLSEIINEIFGKPSQNLNSYVYKPLLFLLFLSLTSGYLLSDIFLGLGSDFFSNIIFINPVQNQIFFEKHFEIFFLKILPILISLFFFFWYF